MKTAFLSCFLALIGLSSLQAQFPYPYEPMVVENAHWIVKQGYYGPYQGWIEYYDYFLQGDTLADLAFVINEHNQVLDTLTQVVYKKLHRRLVHPTGDLPPAPGYVNYALSDPVYTFDWLREDTTNRKVYVASMYLGGSLQNHFYERLLYNFSLSTGDTLAQGETDLNFFTPYVVDSVRRETHWGKERTTQYLSQFGILNGGDWRPTLWEGVGNEGGVVWRFGDSNSYDVFWSESDLLDYCIGDDSTCGIAVLPIVNSKEDLLPSNWQVFPNPASDALTLLLPDWQGGRSYEIRWIDALGRTCKSAHLTASEQRFSLSELPPGWYVLELRREGQLLGRQKVVVE